MNLLAIDASSEKLSYSFIVKGQAIFEYNRIAGSRASGLAYYLEKNLKRLSLSVRNFDAFVVGAGPGSFTGLKVSFSMVKAFSLVTKKPVFSPNSFFACAWPLRQKARKIAVIADARKNLIYASFFTSGPGGLRQKTKPRLMQLTDCIDKKKDYLFLTYDFRLRDQALAIDPSLNFYNKDIYPRAKYLVNSLDNSKIKGSFCDLVDLKPLYLHPINYKVKKGGL